MANRIVFREFAANIKCLHSQGYSPLCESSISGARGGAHGARGTCATLHNDVRRGARCVKLLLHGAQNI